MELSTPIAALVLINAAAMIVLNGLIILPKVRPFLAGQLDS
jgi:hypothetical protein